MLRSDLEAEVARQLGDPNNTRWTTAIIDLRLDAAELDIQKQTNAVKTSSTYTPVAEVKEVVVSANIIDILRATYTLADGTVKTDKRGFQPISRWDLDFQRPNWQNESSGEPMLWSFDASTKSIILTPKPSAANVNTNCLTLLEVRQVTTPLSQGTASSSPFDGNSLMVPYHRALVYYAVAECLKDNDDQISLQKSKYFKSNSLTEPGEYEAQIKMILMKFDVPEAIPAKVQFQPTGGRMSGNAVWPGKANPLFWT